MSTLQERITETSTWVPKVRAEMHRVLIGQEALVDRVFVAMLTNGHILLEGVPGLAKTLTVKALLANWTMITELTVYRN